MVPSVQHLPKTRMILTSNSRKKVALSLLLQNRSHQLAEDHAVYIDTSRPNKSDNSAPFYETRIEERYLNSSLPKKAYRVETFRGQGKTKNRKGYLKIYFVGLCKFIKENPTEAESRNIKLVSDASFLEKVTANTLEIYQRMIDSVLDRTGSMPHSVLLAN